MRLKDVGDAICFTLILVVPVGLMLYVYVEMFAGWIIDIYNGPYARLFAWTVLLSPIVWYAYGRARMINYNNRGRYDGGIDLHRPRGE